MDHLGRNRVRLPHRLHLRQGEDTASSSQMICAQLFTQRMPCGDRGADVPKGPISFGVALAFVRAGPGSYGLHTSHGIRYDTAAVQARTVRNVIE
jgi:hypothetical protein